jgi:hypothetical protein
MESQNMIADMYKRREKLAYNVFSCRRKGFKQSIVEVISSGAEHVGSYIQEEFKSLVNIKGELRDRDGDLLLNVKSSGFTGDFTLNDGDGHLWARFYNRRFPYEYTTIFRDVYNDMVEMSYCFSEKHKILLLGMVGLSIFESEQPGVGAEG